MSEQDKQQSSSRDQILRHVDSKGHVTEFTVGQLQDMGLISQSGAGDSDRGKKHDIGPAHLEWGEFVDYGHD